MAVDVDDGCLEASPLAVLKKANEDGDTREEKTLVLGQGALFSVNLSESAPWLGPPGVESKIAVP